jgi:hypothetical protein
MNKKLVFPVAAVAAVGLLAVPARGDGKGGRNLRASLRARNEVPLVSSAATGTFRARVADDGQSFEYWLDYSGFEGTVTQSHIHIAQVFASGGISVWLCQTAGTPAPAVVAAQTPMCGEPGGDGPEATGVISMEDVIGPAGQAVPPAATNPMAFAELLRLIRSGNAYANVHSTSAPGGEVRGQIQVDDDHHDRDDDDR